MRVMLFLLIIFMCSVSYGQLPITSDNIIVLVSSSTDHPLSRAVESDFQHINIKTLLKNKDYQYVHYYGEEIKEHRRKWGVKWFPSVIHLKKINNKWYRHKILDSKQVNITQQTILQFLGVQTQIQPQAQNYGRPAPQGDS